MKSRVTSSAFCSSSKIIFAYRCTSWPSLLFRFSLLQVEIGKYLLYSSCMMVFGNLIVYILDESDALVYYWYRVEKDTANIKHELEDLKVVTDEVVRAKVDLVVNTLKSQWFLAMLTVLTCSRNHKYNQNTATLFCKSFFRDTTLGWKSSPALWIFI